jgi:hexosaminidase
MKPRYFYSVILFLFVLLVSSCRNSQNKTDQFNSNTRTDLKLLPVPQRVSFTGRNFTISNDWIFDPGSNIYMDDPVANSLVSGLKERANLEINSKRLNRRNNSRRYLIRLKIIPGSVNPVVAADTNRAAISEQAYLLKLTPSEIDINANAPQGLFYGVQTLLQLLKVEKGKVILPEGEIMDWPDLELRIIYWDCSHHLDRIETFKRVIRQAAYFKINAVALKLEGHFQFKSAEPVIEPFALTPAQYQELTDYAKAHFVQLIPYLDAPAHVSFILKHPEYAEMRAFPNINYEFSVTNPKTYELITGMFNDLMEANQGGKYILLSTDEAYYVGKTDNEKKAAETLGGNGKLLTDFITRIGNKLHEKERTVIFWGEYPLTFSDIEALPSHLVNGEYNDSWASELKQHGIRQLIYTSTQGVEPLFPNYYFLPDNKSLAEDYTMIRSDDEQQQPDASGGRVDELLKTIYTSIADEKSDFIGVIVAAWGDAGLHTETFWLGYATGNAAAWNLKPLNSSELSDRFFASFYGPGALKMKRIYQLLSTQAEFWNDSWDWESSTLRTPILGNSKGIFDKPRPARDQTLPMLPIPSGRYLSIEKDWCAENSDRLRSAEKILKENDELVDLLYQNLKVVDNQKYNLEVMLSIARLCRQNLEMLLDLREMDKLLKLASDVASEYPAKAILQIDQALDKVETIHQQRDECLKSLTAVWYQDWYPRVDKANGRTYLDQVDDIKDHLPLRTTDMSYLIYREIHYPLGKWAEEVLNARNQFAKKNHLPARTDVIDF